MPNPLLQSFFGAMNTSKRKNAHNYGDPDPEKQGIEPIPEEYEGENNAYRGIEQHGVTPTELAKPFTGFEGEQVGLATLPSVREIDPIPVINVTQSGREIKDWRAHRLSLNNSKGSQRLIGRNLSRSSILIKNFDPADSVWISRGPISNSSAADAFKLGATDDVTLQTQEPIYVLTDSADMVHVGALEFFATKLPDQE